MRSQTARGRRRDWKVDRASPSRVSAPIIAPVKRRRLTSRGARKLGERERLAGLDPSDEAARWLAEHDPDPAPPPPKSARKSKALHRWRRRQADA